jgi:hypothetical protein
MSARVQLLGVALFTIMTQTVTIVFYFCRALNPTVNLAINALLSIFWATGFGLLAWAMSGTLVHRCDAANWGNDAGIMVCRLYKALFTFSLTGLYVHSSEQSHTPVLVLLRQGIIHMLTPSCTGTE